mmetsp:Transcript_103930/g.303398  ORF Transcript_103930/g.303398 Transcript_103930/m.303398 type:complete len:205 (-) Transcript_103930:26-640(-)
MDCRIASSASPPRSSKAPQRPADRAGSGRDGREACSGGRTRAPCRSGPRRSEAAPRGPPWAPPPSRRSSGTERGTPTSRSFCGSSDSTKAPCPSCSGSAQRQSALMPRTGCSPGVSAPRTAGMTRSCHPSGGPRCRCSTSECARPSPPGLSAPPCCPRRRHLQRTARRSPRRRARAARGRRPHPPGRRRPLPGAAPQRGPRPAS